jgi:hypothetical protein
MLDAGVHMLSTALDLLLEQQSERGLGQLIVVSSDSGAMTASIGTVLDAYVEHQLLSTYRVLVLADGAMRPIGNITSQNDADAVHTVLRRLMLTIKRDGAQLHLITAGFCRLSVLAVALAQTLFDEADAIWLLHTSEAYARRGALHPESLGDAQLIRVPDTRHSGYPPSEFERQRKFIDHDLSNRERQIVTLIARDRYTNRQIAHMLHLSDKTIENRLHADIFPRLRQFLGLAAYMPITRQDLIATFALYFAGQQRLSTFER